MVICMDNLVERSFFSFFGKVREERRGGEER
jgi:hypothetical protein